MSKYPRFALIDATFRPSRTDDLRPGSEKWIGHRTVWEAIGEIEEGPRAGQAMFQIEVSVQNAMRERGEALPPFVWVSEDDLVIHCPAFDVRFGVNGWQEFMGAIKRAHQSSERINQASASINSWLHLR